MNNKWEVVDENSMGVFAVWLAPNAVVYRHKESGAILAATGDGSIFTVANYSDQAHIKVLGRFIPTAGEDLYLKAEQLILSPNDGNGTASVSINPGSVGSLEQSAMAALQAMDAVTGAAGMLKPEEGSTQVSVPVEPIQIMDSQDTEPAEAVTSTAPEETEKEHPVT